MYRKVFKRLFDILLSGIALLVLSWLFALIAIAVRATMGSPVIFRQERPGKNGKVFTIYKFRTMSDKRDEYGELLPDEYRITGFGNFLRASSFDELPELYNIFKGDMSIIGPRPLLTEYLPLYNEKQKHRHDVRPGLTGLAQINGRNALSWEDKFALDVEYVENLTFLNDVTIFLKTIVNVLKRDGINNDSAATMYKFTGNNGEAERVNE